MAKAIFTSRAIKAISVPSSKDSVTFSQQGVFGLQLRVWWRKDALRSSENVSSNSYRYQWLFRFRIPSDKAKMAVMHMGSWPAMSPETAIGEATYYHKLIKSGLDPRIVKLEEKADELRAMDVISNAPMRYRIENVLAKFAQYWPSTGKDQETLDQYEYTITNYLLTTHRGMDIRTITVAKWEKIIFNLANIEGKKGAANNLHKAGRRLLNFAVKEELIDRNPLLGMSDVLRVIHLDPDVRFLESEQLHTLLNELDDQDIAPWAIATVKLMLRCGGRVEEWRRVKICWIKFEHKRIEVPKEAMKNRRKAWIYLTDPAVDILLTWLKELKARHGQLSKSWYLFGSPSDPRKENATDLSKETTKLGKWLDFSPKLLRKTISTQLQRKGCPPAVLRAIRNQVIAQGVEAHYDFDDLFHLKIEWLEKWDKYLNTVKKDPSALVPEKERKLSKKHVGRVEALFR